VTITCSNCGKDFETCRSRQDEKKYCSNECYYADSDREFIDCEVCGDTFKVHGKYTDDARFCSQDCYGEWLSETNSGEDCWNYQGKDAFKREIDYGPGWNEKIRHYVRARDGYKCRDCGISQDKHLEKTGKRLHVHHTIPARDREDPQVYNAVGNLITLCSKCHGQRGE